MSGGYAIQGSGSDILQSVKLVIPAAQVLQLFTTPVQLLPAPGANKLIMPVRIIQKMNFRTAAYAAGQTMIVRFSGNTVGANTYGDSTIFQSTITRMSMVSYNVTTGTNAINYAINSPIVITSSPANPSGGDSDIVIYMTYYIIDVS